MSLFEEDIDNGEAELRTTMELLNSLIEGFVKQGSDFHGLVYDV